MQIDNSALVFNSSPLYRFILQEGKFKGVEFYFKNVELDHHNTPDSFDVAFETEIIGGNYKDKGYEGEMTHLNSLVNEKNEDMFKLEIGKILHNLLLLNDPRVILHKGRIDVK